MSDIGENPPINEPLPTETANNDQLSACIGAGAIGFVAGVGATLAFNALNDMQNIEPISLVGGTLQAAHETIAAAHGKYSLRLIQVNEYPAIGTADYNPCRINVKVITTTQTLLPLTRTAAFNLAQSNPELCRVVTVTMG